MTTKKQEEMAKRRELVLRALKKLKKARYQEILDAIQNSEKSDKEINYQMVRGIFNHWSEHGLKGDKGSVEDLGNGVWQYHRPKREQMPKPRFAAYGYRWKKDLVQWDLDRKQGRPKKGDRVEKALWGKKARGNSVNFAEQVGVYLLHNGDRTVYAGRIKGGENAKRGIYDRLREHAKDSLKDDWNTFSWFGLRPVNKDGTLSENHVPPIDDENKELLQLIATIEAVIINGIRPRGNSRGGDTGGDLKYEQCAKPKQEG